MSPQEIEAAVAEIRERVQERHRKTVKDLDGFALPALEPLGHARDAAEGKAAAIGRVNPRPGGPVNNAVQYAKRLIARCLNWFVRDQIDYNRAVIAYMERATETLIEQNRNLLLLARESVEMRDSVMRIHEALEGMRRNAAGLDEMQRDMLTHWNNWRPEWEKRLTDNEIKFLHMVREIESAARVREEADKSRAARMHEDYAAALAQSVESLQKRFWADMRKQRDEQERTVRTELRLIRQRSRAQAETPPPPAAAGTAEAVPRMDYGYFQERFRGSEEYVAKSQSPYLEICRGLEPVADLGCGRGELLELLRGAGVECLGVDADPAAVGVCRDKGLNVAADDLFAFLQKQESGSLGAVVCAHVVEHLPPLRLPELVALAAAKLKPGGILALETPNPACLAIFAGDFYLDPTHRRPAPAQQLRFYMEESGLGAVEVRERNPAYESIAELARLREEPAARPFVEKFFGGLDYVILGKKP